STGRGTPRPGRAERQERGEPVAFAQPATNAENPARGLLAGGSGEAARDGERAEWAAGTRRSVTPRGARQADGAGGGQGEHAGRPETGGAERRRPRRGRCPHRTAAGPDPRRVEPHP